MGAQKNRRVPDGRKRGGDESNLPRNATGCVAARRAGTQACYCTSHWAVPAHAKGLAPPSEMWREARQCFSFIEQLLDMVKHRHKRRAKQMKFHSIEANSRCLPDGSCFYHYSTSQTPWKHEKSARFVLKWGNKNVDKNGLIIGPLFAQRNRLSEPYFSENQTLRY